MGKTIHRIKEFIDYKKLSMRKFDLSIGASDGYIQRTFKNDGSVGSDLIEKIIGTYTEINPYWLIAGEGAMLREEVEENLLSETTPGYKTDYFEQALLKYLDSPRVKDKVKKILKDAEEEKNSD